MKNTPRNGFTIVELLIVIVVIGILATISLVAYGGVQDRARVTKTIATAKNYIEGFRIWEATEGDAPRGASSCLGPASAYPSGICPSAEAWGSNNVFDTAFNTKLNGYSGLSTGQMGYWGNNPVGAMWYHGNYWGGHHAILMYMLPIAYDCGLPNVLSGPYSMLVSGTNAKFTNRANGLTYCAIEIAAPPV